MTYMEYAEDKQSPLISIVLTSYNSMATLPSVLNSILNQTYPLDRIELIIVDGGSRDRTIEIEREFIAKYRHLFHDIKLIIHNRNYGVSKARNDGIRIAQGKYILILDHDVYMQENTISTLVNYLENSPSKVSGVIPLHNTLCGGRLETWLRLIYLNKISKTNALTSCCLIRRELINEIGYYDETLGPPYGPYEDIEYGARALAKGFEIHLLGTHEVLHDQCTQPNHIDSEVGNKEHKLNKLLKRIYSLTDSNYRRAIKKYVKSLPLTYKLRWALYAILPIYLLASVVTLPLGFPLYYTLVPLILALYLDITREYWNPRLPHISLAYSAIALLWRVMRALTLLIPQDIRHCVKILENI